MGDSFPFFYPNYILYDNQILEIVRSDTTSADADLNPNFKINY